MARRQMSSARRRRGAGYRARTRRARPTSGSGSALREALAELIAPLRRARVRVEQRTLALGFQLVAESLRRLQLPCVPGLDRVLVLGLPALAPFLRRFAGTVDGLLDRALILGCPPLATLLHLADDPIGDHAASALGLRGSRGPVLAVPGPMLGRLPGRALRCHLGCPLVLGLPPHAQHLGFTGSTVDGILTGAFIHGVPPRAQLQRLAVGALLRFPDLTFFFVRPALPQLTQLALGAFRGGA